MQTHTVSAHSSLNPSLFNNLQVQVPSPSQIMSLEHQYDPNNENLVLTHNVMNWIIGSTHATHLLLTGSVHTLRCVEIQFIVFVDGGNSKAEEEE